MKKSLRLAAIITLIAVLFISAASLYGCTPKKEFMEQDTYFFITDFSLLGYDMNLAGLLEKGESYVLLRSDGTCHISIKPNKGLIALGNELLRQIDIDDEYLRSFSFQYLEVMFPGFTIDDVSYSLSLLQSVGAKLAGLEEGIPEYEQFKNALESGNGLNNVSIPKTLAIEVDTVYEIKHLRSQYSGDYTAVYIGRYDETYSKEPYIICTLYENEDGKTCLKARFEILKASINTVIAG